MIKAGMTSFKFFVDSDNLELLFSIIHIIFYQADTVWMYDRNSTS